MLVKTSEKFLAAGFFSVGMTSRMSLLKRILSTSAPATRHQMSQRYFIYINVWVKWFITWNWQNSDLWFSIELYLKSLWLNRLLVLTFLLDENWDFPKVSWCAVRASVRSEADTQKFSTLVSLWWFTFVTSGVIAGYTERLSLHINQKWLVFSWSQKIKVSFE